MNEPAWPRHPIIDGQSRSDLLDFAGMLPDSNSEAWVCRHVHEGAAIKFYVYDESYLHQFLCGAEGHDYGEELVVDLIDAIRGHPELSNLPPVPAAHEASYDDPSGRWVVSPISD